MPYRGASGEKITFESMRRGNRDIFSIAADGGERPEALVSTDLREVPLDWSHGGNYLLYGVNHPETFRKER